MSQKRKFVLITGGAKGIGLSTAEAFSKAGALVAILDLVIPESLATDGRFLCFTADASDSTQVQTVFTSIEQQWGKLDILVNNAGIQRYGTVVDTPEEEWDQVMNVNLKSAFLCAKYAVPLIQKGGSGVVINVASVQSFITQERVAAYTSSKAALLGLTRSIAVDFGPGIRSVAVCPGTVDTPMLRDAINAMEDPESVMQECRDMHLVKRIALPSEVAELILYLASDKAGFITGQAIRIDGGLGIKIGGN